MAEGTRLMFPRTIRALNLSLTFCTDDILLHCADDLFLSIKHGNKTSQTQTDQNPRRCFCRNMIAGYWTSCEPPSVHLIHLYTWVFSQQPRLFGVLHGASSVGSSPSRTSGPQVVPKFHERLPVLPDQLVAEQDVPAGRERRGTECMMGSLACHWKTLRAQH